jgi:hypothetical protein
MTVNHKVGRIWKVKYFKVTYCPHLVEVALENRKSNRNADLRIEKWTKNLLNYSD